MLLRSRTKNQTRKSLHAHSNYSFLKMMMIKGWWWWWWWWRGCQGVPEILAIPWKATVILRTSLSVTRWQSNAVSTTQKSVTYNSKHVFYHMHLQVDWAALLISFRLGSSLWFQIRSSTGSFPLSEMSRLPPAESSHGGSRMFPCASPSYMPAPYSRGRDSPSISSENCKVKWQKFGWYQKEWRNGTN